MKLQFLGTAAAEGIPAIFCTCETCRIARQKGGKNIRSRCQSLVDDRLLIDFGPDTYYHSMRDGIDLTYVFNVLITHVHEDHLYPKELNNYCKGFANLPEDHPKFHFWGSGEMVKQLTPIVENPKMLGRVELHELAPFTPTVIDKYTVTALPAYHGTESPYFYIIEGEDKTILYAHDTGAFKQEVWEYFAKAKPHFDLITFDCTMGNRPVKPCSHLGFVDIKALREKLVTAGYSDDKTVYVANHFSHNSPDVNYEDRGVYEKEGYVMSHDSLVLEF